MWRTIYFAEIDKLCQMSNQRKETFFFLYSSIYKFEKTNIYAVSALAGAQHNSCDSAKGTTWFWEHRFCIVSALRGFTTDFSVVPRFGLPLVAEVKLGSWRAFSRLVSENKSVGVPRDHFMMQTEAWKVEKSRKCAAKMHCYFEGQC